MSNERKIFLKNIKNKKIIVLLSQIFILISFLITWELLSKYKIINSFITSSPSKILNELILLINNNNLFNHILRTLYEIIISFSLSLIISIILASILWYSNMLNKILEPYITIINSLPKVALGPIFIIWIGANTKSVIVMSLFISVIVTTITILNGFKNVDKNKIELLKSYNASKFQIFKLLIFRSNINTILDACKINVGMTLTGVIMGELLVSKEGIGYLIMYGSQIFNLNLVMTGIVILSILSYLLFIIVSKIEKKLAKN